MPPASATDQPGTVGALVGRCLAGLGARRVFAASPLTPTDPMVIAPSTDLGLGLHPVGDADLALLLAGVAGRIGPGPGVAILDGQRVVLTSTPGGKPHVVSITEAGHLPGALASWGIGAVHDSVEFQLDLDLGAPVPAGLAPMVFDDTSNDLVTLSPTLADFAGVVLVGPGVVRAGHVAGARALGASGGFGVVTTWWAHGVIAWDDPHHFATVGLQERDFELSGLNDAQLIITSGLDPLEAPPSRWGDSAQVLEVEPWQLSTLTHHWPDPAPVAARPPLMGHLEDALADRYVSAEVPLAPARAVADLRAVVPKGGLVLADPGPAGLWVARAARSSEPGAVIVPASFCRGFAAAGAVVAALDRRRAVAVTTDPIDPATAQLLELARRWELPMVVEVWGGDAPLESADDHAVSLAGALERPGVDVVGVPVAFADTALLVEVAGEVIAWQRPQN